jgi:hypothetical protein
MPILASSPNENKPTGDSSILLCSPRDATHHDIMSHRSWVHRRPAAAVAGWHEAKSESGRRAVIYRSSRQSCGEWQFNEESLFVFWFKIILSHYLHDYFPVMHFAGSGLEYNTTIVHLIINYRRREECKSGGGSREQRNRPLLFALRHCH